MPPVATSPPAADDKVVTSQTLNDGAHLLKALVETARPGDAAVVLIHVDARVGTASRDDGGGADDPEEEFLYHDSALRRYVDACLAAPACARDGRRAADPAANATAHAEAVLLEVHSHFSPEWSKWSMRLTTRTLSSCKNSANTAQSRLGDAFHH